MQVFCLIQMQTNPVKARVVPFANKTQENACVCV